MVDGSSVSAQTAPGDGGGVDGGLVGGVVGAAVVLLVVLAAVVFVRSHRATPPKAVIGAGAQVEVVGVPSTAEPTEAADGADGEKI